MPAQFFLIQAIFLVFSSLLGGLLIRWSTSLVARFKPRFAQAYGVALLGSLTALAVRFAFSFVEEEAGAVGTIGLGLLASFLGIVIHVIFVGMMIKNEDGEAVGVGRGILVTIMEIPIAMGLGIVLMAIGFGLLAATGSLEKAGDLIKRFPETYRQGAMSFGQPVPWAQPNRFKSVDHAKREAVRQHPELGVAGSRFNRAYLERHRQYQRERPSYFNDNAWPVTLADEIAAEQ